MTIRVLLADDQALLRQTFRILLESEPDIQVVAEAGEGAEAVRLARTLRPDVVVMDIRMPGSDGLAATREICADPGLSATHILILTTFETDEYVVAAIRAGASGFLGKDISASELLEGVRTVAAGEALLSSHATRALIAEFMTIPEPGSQIADQSKLDLLTSRERELTVLAAEGLSNGEIATRLTLSPLTVRTHIHHAMTKLQARDRAQLVVIAYQTGLVRP